MRLSGNHNFRVGDIQERQYFDEWAGFFLNGLCVGLIGPSVQPEVERASLPA